YILYLLGLMIFVSHIIGQIDVKGKSLSDDLYHMFVIKAGGRVHRAIYFKVLSFAILFITYFEKFLTETAHQILSTRVVLNHWCRNHGQTNQSINTTTSISVIVIPFELHHVIVHVLFPTRLSPFSSHYSHL